MVCGEIAVLKPGVNWPVNPDIALKQLQESVIKHGLVHWSVSLDTAVKRFGLCDFKHKRISLSRKLCELNSDDEVSDTILHEIAHAMAFERHGVNCGHDDRWKAICVEIGARPVACYGESVVQPDAPWVLVHKQTGEIFRSYYKRPSRDWSNVWIRGRKKDTLGQLAIKAVSQMDKTQSDDENSGSKQINHFNDQSVLDVHQGLTELVKQYAAEHGLRLSSTRCKYNSHKLDLTLSLRVPISEDSKEEERIEFAALAPIFNLTGEDYLKPFTVDGRMFTLIGFKPNNRKYPIIATDEAGRRYKFEVDVLDQFAATSADK